MRCNECGFTVPYHKAPDLENCNMCNIPLNPTIDDILKHGMFGITNEVRPSQIELANDVETLLAKEDGGVLIAQGGTGIGKTFAYLIPAMLSGKRIIISTAKKALQTQLVSKDIPFLAKKIGCNVSYCLYKGKSNYACWMLDQEVPTYARPAFNKFIKRAKADKVPADLSNWDGPEPHWWNKIHLDNCPLGSKCVHYKNCRPIPKDSQIVVTNHHLTGIDLKMHPGTLLGEYQVIVFDEAHHMPEAARTAFEKNVTVKRIQAMKKNLSKDDLLKNFIDIGTKLPLASIITSVNTLETVFKALHSKAKNKAARTGIIDCKVLTLEASEVEQITSKLGESLSIIKSDVQQTYEKQTQNHVDGDFSNGELLAIKSRVQKLHNGVSSLFQLAEQIVKMSTKPESNTNTGTSKEQTYNVITTDGGLKYIPRNIGKELSPRLSLVEHKILMSATLAVGGDFSYTKNLWGFNDDKNLVTERNYDSPFNLQKQTKLYLPMHLPLFNSGFDPDARREWVHSLSTEIAQLVGAVGGDAFVLFASKVDMNDFADEIGNDLQVPLILQQGDASAVLREYMRTDNAVLFGLKSFWEGVDIPGDKLRLVIIPRLPFPSPYDPVIATMQEDAKNGFKEVMVPHMIFDMKQGVGRLIRTTADRGIIAILDVRAWTGTSNIGKHKIKLQRIKSMTGMPRMGYGNEMLKELGLTNFHYDFTVIKKSASKLFSDVKND